MNKAEKLAADFGAELDTDGGAWMLYAKPGHCFPSNTTHCLAVIPPTIAELKFWLDDMSRCGDNECEVCVDWLTEMPAPEGVN